jgi:hypothetical protein
LPRGEEEFTPLDIPNNFIIEFKVEEKNAKPLLIVTCNARN